MMSVGEEQVRERAAERRLRFGLLLLAIAAAFAVQGVGNPGRVEQVVVSVLLGTTLVLSLWVAQARPRVMKLFVVLAAALVVLSVVEAVAGESNGAAVRLANLMLVTLAPPAIVVGILRTLRATRRVTVDAVFGVLCLYLMLGMFFASLYSSIGRINGTFFANGVETTISKCIYFSFTTLTTTGYGDLTAKGNLGHTLAISEALLGQIYLVTVVSVIVANLGQGRPRDRMQARDTRDGG